MSNQPTEPDTSNETNNESGSSTLIPETAPIYEEEFEVEGILSMGVPKTGPRYLIKWLGYEHPTWEPEEHMANCEELLEKFWNENDNHNLMRRREKYIREWARTMNVHPPKFLFDEVQPIKTEGVDVITPSITSTDIGKGKTKKAKKTPTTATKQSTKKKVESVHKTATATATTTAKRGKKEDKEDSSQATKHSSDISHSTPTHQSSLASSSTNVDASHTTVSDVLSNITTPTLTPRQKEKMPEFIPTISSDEEEEHDDDDDDVVVVQKPAKKRAKLDKSISRVGAGDKAKAMQPIDLSTPPSASHNYYATSTMPSTTISIESDSSIISNFDYRIPKRVRDTNTDTETAHEQAVTSSRDILVVPDDEISTMAISTSGHATPKPQYTTTSNASAAVSGKSSLLDSVMERISSTSNTSNTTTDIHSNAKRPSSYLPSIYLNLFCGTSVQACHCRATWLYGVSNNDESEAHAILTPDCTIRVRYLFPNTISEAFLQGATTGKHALPRMVALQTPEDNSGTNHSLVLDRLAQFLLQRESVGVIASNDKVFGLIPLKTIIDWFPQVKRAVPPNSIGSHTPLIMALMASNVQSRRTRNDPIHLLSPHQPARPINSYRQLFAHDIELSWKGLKTNAVVYTIIRPELSDTYDLLQENDDQEHLQAILSILPPNSMETTDLGHSELRLVLVHVASLRTLLLHPGFRALTRRPTVRFLQYGVQLGSMGVREILYPGGVVVARLPVLLSRYRWLDDLHALLHKLPHWTLAIGHVDLVNLLTKIQNPQSTSYTRYTIMEWQWAVETFEILEQLAVEQRLSIHPVSSAGSNLLTTLSDQLRWRRVIELVANQHDATLLDDDRTTSTSSTTTRAIVGDPIPLPTPPINGYDTTHSKDYLGTQGPIFQYETMTLTEFTNFAYQWLMN